MRVIDKEECVRRGLADVMAEARAIVGDRDVYVTFDPGGMTALAGATMMFELLCVIAARVAPFREARNG